MFFFIYIYINTGGTRNNDPDSILFFDIHGIHSELCFGHYSVCPPVELLIHVFLDL